MYAFETEEGIACASVRESVEGGAKAEETAVGGWDADGAAEVRPNAEWAGGAEGMVSGLQGGGDEDGPAVQSEERAFAA